MQTAQSQILCISSSQTDNILMAWEKSAGPGPIQIACDESPQLRQTMLSGMTHKHSHTWVSRTRGLAHTRQVEAKVCIHLHSDKSPDLSHTKPSSTPISDSVNTWISMWMPSLLAFFGFYFGVLQLRASGLVHLSLPAAKSCSSIHSNGHIQLCIITKQQWLTSLKCMLSPHASRHISHFLVSLFQFNLTLKKKAHVTHWTFMCFFFSPLLAVSCSQKQIQTPVNQALMTALNILLPSLKGI